MERWRLHRGDCRDFLKILPENSVDAVVTDPPYELNFMNREWDRTGIAFDPAFWIEVLRVLKPGGHVLAAGIGRTHHRMMVAVEDAGFEIRDCIYHIFGSGFPKNLDVSKAIDKLKGAKRAGSAVVLGKEGAFTYSGLRVIETSAPATEEASRWKGWGTALKPAVEIWVLARKPLSERNVTENVLRWGTGALNIDECRIPGVSEATQFDPSKHGHDRRRMTVAGRDCAERAKVKGGRWPANLVLSHTEGCVFKGYKRVKGSGSSKIFHGPYDGVSATGFPRGWSHPGNQHAGPDGTEAVEDWECVLGCPVRLLDEQGGERISASALYGTVSGRSSLFGGGSPGMAFASGYSASGGASRFFYCAKVSRSERWGWCRDCRRAASPEEIGAHHAEGHDVVIHPTQKPLKLMRWLVRLVTPPSGLVLDPFAGSGTILVAALLEGFRCAGAESDPEYAGVAEARLRAVAGEGAQPLLLGGGAEQLTLF